MIKKKSKRLFSTVNAQTIAGSETQAVMENLFLWGQMKCFLWKYHWTIRAVKPWRTNQTLDLQQKHTDSDPQPLMISWKIQSCHSLPEKPVLFHWSDQAVMLLVLLLPRYQAVLKEEFNWKSSFTHLMPFQTRMLLLQSSDNSKNDKKAPYLCKYYVNIYICQYCRFLY